MCDIIRATCSDTPMMWVVSEKRGIKGDECKDLGFSSTLFMCSLGHIQPSLVLGSKFRLQGVWVLSHCFRVPQCIQALGLPGILHSVRMLV